ncbi:MAG: sodium:solute symporter family transporter, partial [Bacteroidales bacterium]
MNKLDIVIIFAYLICLMIFGVVLGKTNKSQEDYFLAKRKLPWYAVGLSIMATMLSASSFIAGPGWAYTSGLGPFVVNMTVPLAAFFVLYTMVPVYYHLKVTSVYEYVGKRFGYKTRLICVLGFIINSLIQVSSFVFIPALIIQTLTGWNIIYIVVGIVLISIFYTITGCIKGVVLSDTLQMILMWIGLFVILFIILKE